MRRDYVLYGGLPLIPYFETSDQKADFLKLLFEETYISDIIGRNKVRNKAELEELLNILSSATGLRRLLLQKMRWRRSITKMEYW